MAQALKARLTNKRRERLDRNNPKGIVQLTTTTRIHIRYYSPQMPITLINAAEKVDIILQRKEIELLS